MIAAPGKLDKVEHTYISHDVVFCGLLCSSYISHHAGLDFRAPQKK